MSDLKSIKTGEQFEQFCEEMIRAKGLHIAVRPSRGPDAGADMIAVSTSVDELGFEQESRILIECKHYARSQRSVREADVGNIVE